MWYCLSFNPYRVFKFVATVGAKGWTMACGVVSIPIGFSSSLQRGHINTGKARSYGFNPYRVFKFVATGFTISFFAI